MKIFIDSADIEEITKAYELGVLDGITTNPSLIKKAAEKHGVQDMKAYLTTLLQEAKGTPVSLEVIGTSYEELIQEGERLYKTFNKVAKNIVIKIPIHTCTTELCEHSTDALRAIKYLSDKGIPVNCTLIFTPEQALLAAKAGALYVSPFAGRIDDFIRTNAKQTYDKEAYYPMEGSMQKNKRLTDNGIVSGVDLVAQCVLILKEYKTEVLAASLRNPRQVRECALVGSDVATIPYKVLTKLLQHKKTTEGMKSFTKDIVPAYKELFK